MQHPSTAEGDQQPKRPVLEHLITALTRAARAVPSRPVPAIPAEAVLAGPGVLL